MEANDGLFVVVGADIAPLRSALSEASRLSGSFAGDLTRAFEDAALKGRSLAGVLRQLAFSLSSHAFEAALRPLTETLGGGLAQLVSGGLRSILPFASGGVIASPITFPLGVRRMGLAGEAGPEAILPLARGRDGRLGVRAEDGAQTLNVTFNVTAQDAQSFRRSEGQIAAMLNRVVSRGARNL
jgi:phage-related minor tail protein